MRSLFGLVLSVVVGVGITLLDSTSPGRSMSGLVVASIHEGAALFKGGKPYQRGVGRSAVLSIRVTDSASMEVQLPRQVMKDLYVDEGDLLYLSDARWWLGGFRATHVKAGPPSESDETLDLPRSVLNESNLLADRPMRVEKIM